jgi:ubiquinone/menaquinone biosynthesis C-methylase UbiE
LAILWAVSLMAAMSNLAKAFVCKVKSPKRRFLEIFWSMGRSKDHISIFAVDAFSRFNHQAKYGAAGWKSLELFYNYHEMVKPQLNGGIEGFLTRFWIERMHNRQAVANRLKIVVNLLVSALRKFSQEPEIRLLSIASGSAQAVVMAIKKAGIKNVRVVLIDNDQSAIEEAKRLVASEKLTNHFTFYVGTTKLLQEVATNFRPHIIEMVGFLDYRSKQKAISLIAKIYSHLPPGGVFLTCNINRNAEKIFLDWVLLWPMIYRSAEELHELLRKGGFHEQNIDLYYEPHRIHSIAYCER